MSVDYPIIGERIKNARKQCRITQEQLAERLSVSVGYISQLERGITKVNLDTLSRISTELECDITYFLTGVNQSQAQYLNHELDVAISKMSQNQKRCFMK